MTIGERINNDIGVDAENDNWRRWQSLSEFDNGVQKQDAENFLQRESSLNVIEDSLEMPDVTLLKAQDYWKLCDAEFESAFNDKMQQYGVWYRKAIFPVGEPETEEDRDFYNQHLRCDLAAAERAHSLDQGELRRLAEQLKTDSSLETAAEVAKYFHEALGVESGLIVTDVEVLKNSGENDDFSDTSASASCIGGIDDASGEYVTCLVLNMTMWNRLGYNEWLAMDTISHEIWHAYQLSLAYKLVKGEISENSDDRARAESYFYNRVNYVSASLDYDKYKSQLLESEANWFAEEVKMAKFDGWRFDFNEQYEWNRAKEPIEENFGDDGWSYDYDYDGYEYDDYYDE